MSRTSSILARQHADTLNRFALSNVLVALDYDGTLAPIAPTPGAARMRDQTRHLLGKVAELYPCVVISGRALADLERRLAGVPVSWLVGNHGLETRADSSEPQARGWSQILEGRLPAVPGLIIEDKGHTITVHYRLVEDKAGMRKAIQDALADLPDARALGGIEAISLLPRDGRNKGTALRETQRQFGCDTAIYVGDDETDEDAFRSGSPDDLLSIRVGQSPETAAQFWLDEQTDIDAFLNELIAARDRARGVRRVRI
jgi:trehalose 6-phosphate phosphatase